MAGEAPWILCESNGQIDRLFPVHMRLTRSITLGREAKSLKHYHIVRFELQTFDSNRL
jgi:hypothetical protein